MSYSEETWLERMYHWAESSDFKDKDALFDRLLEKALAMPMEDATRQHIKDQAERLRAFGKRRVRCNPNLMVQIAREAYSMAAYRQMEEALRATAEDYMEETKP